MIETALFSWKGTTSAMSLWNSFLWCGSFNYARRHFKNLVLVADDKAKKFLVEQLGLQFDEVIDLPSIPDDLCHVYDLPKLHAAAIMAARGVPYLHVDYDAFLRRKLPDHILEAPLACEFLFETTQSVIDINNGLPVPRFGVGVVPKYSCASGIIGGNDLVTILDYSKDSIAVGTDIENRSRLVRESGYRASSMLGEAAASGAFGDRVRVLFPRGRDFAEDYWKLGYIHLADLKKDRGAMAQAAELVRLDFEKEYIQTFKNWDSVSLPV